MPGWGIAVVDHGRVPLAVVVTGHHSPDGEALIVLGYEIGIPGILRMEDRYVPVHKQPFHRQFVIQDGYDDVTLLRFQGAVHHQQILIEDAGTLHRVTGDFKDEGGIRVDDDVLIEAEVPGEIILGDRWEPGPDGFQRERHRRRLDQGVEDRAMGDRATGDRATGDRTAFGSFEHMFEYSMSGCRFVIVRSIPPPALPGALEAGSTGGKGMLLRALNRGALILGHMVFGQRDLKVGAARIVHHDDAAAMQLGGPARDGQSQTGTA